MRFRSTLCALLGALPLLSAPVPGQCVDTEYQELLASDRRDNWHLGDSVALVDDMLLAGAHGADAMYVYRRIAGVWTEVQKVQAIDKSQYGSQSSFGTQLHVDGDVAVAGVLDDDERALNAGAAYVLRYNGTLWAEEQKVLAGDGAASDSFGRDAAVSGDVLVVGADGDDDNGNSSGSAYVFRFDGSQWVEEQKLVPADGAAVDSFGFQVAIDGDVIAIAAYKDDTAALDTGSVYVYRHDGSQWVEEQKLVASDAAQSDLFGFSVAVCGDRLLVGAQDRGSAEGAACVFGFDGAQWVEEQVLVPSDAQSSHWFGRAVALEGSDAVVTANLDDTQGTSAGALYLFRLQTGNQGLERQKLVAANGGSSDWLGASVDLHDGRVVAGAPDHDQGYSNVGAACVYEPAELALDANLDAAAAGDSLILTTCGGAPGLPVVLVVSDINGVPAFLKLVHGAFDASGEFAFGGSVPPGLAGLAVDFLSIGFYTAGVVGLSNAHAVSFQ